MVTCCAVTQWCTPGEQRVKSWPERDEAGSEGNFIMKNLTSSIKCVRNNFSLFTGKWLGRGEAGWIEEDNY